jgi:hypothetical protein
MDLAQSNVHAHNKTKGILELPSSLWYQSWCDWRWHVIESWSSSIWRWQTKFNFSGIGPWCVHAEGEAKAPEAVVEVRDAMYPVGTWGLIWRAGFVDLSIRLRKCWATPESAHVVVDMICWWAHINLFLVPVPGEKGCKRLWWTYTTRGGREKERSIYVCDVILLWEGTFVDLIFVLDLCEERDSCVCGGVNVAQIAWRVVVGCHSVSSIAIFY